MNDNSKILEDISTLAQICRSGSDGPTLKIEETEIKNKLSEYNEEIEEIKAIDADDSYDTSAEMADRNIEIITKKVIQSTNNELKNKNMEMDSLKEKEAEYSNSLYGLKRTRVSYEKYIASLKERLTASTEDSVSDRYNNIIANTETKIVKQDERIKEIEEKHAEVQKAMEELHGEITNLEKRLESKKTLLAEAQNNLQNKDLYVDKAKKEKSTRRIKEIEDKQEELNKRLDEISKDPKYLELKIKEILSGGTDNFEARNYIIELLTTASKVPYADRFVDKRIEEELLDATQKRDTFAQEIDSKTYDIMESISPEQIRVEFLNNRISYWQSEIKRLEEKVSKIDKDETFHYSEKTAELDELITKLKEETQDFKSRYEKESDTNLSNKAILKITYEEKLADLEAAEEISSKFRKNEAEDVEDAGRIVKQDIEELNKKVSEAEEEIYQIKDRLDHRKSGNKDISAKNRDREKLEQLAQVVIDIKHRRQFADRTFDIAKRLEFNLGMKLVDAVYSEEDQEKLSKEVMVPIEEPVVEEPVVIEVPEPTPTVEETEEPVAAEATEETAPEVTEEVTPEVSEEVTEEVPETTEEVVPETSTEETPVAEPSQEISVEAAIDEMPTETEVPEATETSAEEVTEEPVAEEATEKVSEVTEEAVSEAAAEVPETTEEVVPETSTEETPVVEEEASVETEVPEVTEESNPFEEASSEKTEQPEIEIPSIEEAKAEETSTEPEITIPAADAEPEGNIDFGIPAISTELEDEPPAPESDGAVIPEITIPDEAPVTESEGSEAEEVVIPEMPPLPDISMDDTTSIPVIPIAEPSTDDNFTFENEETGTESEMPTFPGPISDTESTSESGIE